MRGTGGMLLPSPGRSKREAIGPLGARGIRSATPGFPVPINVSGCTSRHVYPTERASGPDPVQSHVAANLCIARYIVLRESLRETRAAVPRLWHAPCGALAAGGPRFVGAPNTS